MAWRPFLEGDRVRVKQGKFQYLLVNVSYGTVTGSSGGSLVSVLVLHDGGWEGRWRDSALEHVSPLEDLAATLEPEGE